MFCHYTVKSVNNTPKIQLSIQEGKSDHLFAPCMWISCNQNDKSLWNDTFSNSSLIGGVKWDDTHSAASLPISMASFTVATPSLTMTESVSP